MPDAEQQELLLAFVEEGYELLDESEPLLIELESKSAESGEVDNEVINTIFRLYHSLKGGAGFLDLHTVGKVTHEAETLLDLFRKGKGSIRADHVDLLNKSCDFLRKLLQNIENEFNDAGFEQEAEEMIAELKLKIQSITGESQEEEDDDEEYEEEGEEGEGAEQVRVLDDDLSEKLADEAVTGMLPDELELVITPEMIKQFTAESEDLLTATEESFLILDKEPDNEEHIGEAFRSLHSFKGNAGFLGYKDLETLSHHAESVLDQIRLREIPGTSELFSLLFDILDFLRAGVGCIIEGRDPSIMALPGLVNLMQEAVQKAKTKGRKGGKRKKAKEAKTIATQREAKEPAASDAKPATGETSKSDLGETSEAATIATAPQTVIVTEKTPESTPAPDKNAAVTKETKAKKKSVVKPKAEQSNVAQRQSIRVDVEKLEILLDLVGELVIAEAMVAQNPDLQDLQVSLENFEKASMHLNKITRDLQDIATSIRMIPLAGTFRRMIRLVRDLAHKTGKKVDLQIIGEETEVDKTVIEKITDPLVHIIRNSIDHGIGTPEKRKVLNKSEQGKLILEAKYVGGEVWITIKDDGMGLSRERIIQKAIDKGLIEGDGTDMPDHAVWPLIFQPGFSTAEKVTDVSGRGVGMDVVRRNIENIRGKVDIISKSGLGTEVILRIPLTLAIIDGMIIRVGQNRYIIPITTIKETIRAEASAITQTMDGEEIINIRGALFPIIRLHEVYNVEPTFTDLTSGIVMIIEDSDSKFCLFVDELIGQQQIVIKGLSEYIGHINGISGCTILGDGTVCLIIDVAGLPETTENGNAAIQEVAQKELASA